MESKIMHWKHFQIWVPIRMRIVPNLTSSCPIKIALYRSDSESACNRRNEKEYLHPHPKMGVGNKFKIGRHYTNNYIIIINYKFRWISSYTTLRSFGNEKGIIININIQISPFVIGFIFIKAFKSPKFCKEKLVSHSILWGTWVNISHIRPAPSLGTPLATSRAWPPKPYMGIWEKKKKNLRDSHKEFSKVVSMLNRIKSKKQISENVWVILITDMFVISAHSHHDLLLVNIH